MMCVMLARGYGFSDPGNGFGSLPYAVLPLPDCQRQEDAWLTGQNGDRQTAVRVCCKDLPSEDIYDGYQGRIASLGEVIHSWGTVRAVVCQNGQHRCLGYRDGVCIEFDELQKGVEVGRVC